jgi:hypothetical protein
MLCPHCGYENADGRKFCRSCAKPLAGDAAPSQPARTNAPASPTPVQRAASQPVAIQPVTSNMAIASLALSFLAFIFPLGIASVVLGHISRTQIAKSNGRQTGTGLAFAGLILSYLQLIVVGLIGLGLVAAWQSLNRDLDRHPDARAALIERLKNGDPSHPSAAQIEEHRQNTVDALRLLAARQNEYLANHPDEGYACQLYLLGWDPAGQNELTLHLRNSHYDIKIDQCRGTDDNRYAVVAIPRSGNNPPDSPVYCLNQTGVIRKYSASRTNDVNTAILFQHESCPQDGETVE